MLLLFLKFVTHISHYIPSVLHFNYLVTFNKINIRLKKLFNSKSNSNTDKQNSNKSVEQAEIKYISI